jgi:hypothetical protein
MPPLSDKDLQLLDHDITHNGETEMTKPKAKPKVILHFLDQPTPAGVNETPADTFRRGYNDAFTSKMEAAMLHFPEGFEPDAHYIAGYQEGGEAALRLRELASTTCDMDGYHATPENLAAERAALDALMSDYPAERHAKIISDAAEDVVADQEDRRRRNAASPTTN